MRDFGEKILIALIVLSSPIGAVLGILVGIVLGALLGALFWVAALLDKI